MKKITLSLLLFILIGIHGLQAKYGYLTFSSSLNGSNEVPAVTTNAKGVASFILNPTLDTLCINVSATGLSGAITGAHIHSGKAGTTGGVLEDLSSGVSGNRITYAVTGTAAKALFSKLVSGGAYLNIHTAANPNGEIRGQIKLESDHVYVAKLNGANESPSVTTNGKGLAYGVLSQDDSLFSVIGIFTNLTAPITGVHLHNAAAGQNGPVVEDLTGDLSNDTKLFSFELNATSYVNQLKSGNIYLNVHDSVNPNGEIRGQFLPVNDFSFVFYLSGDEEVPKVTTSSFGLGVLSFNNTLDTASYEVVIDSLSGPITGAHLHKGAFGTNGGVVFAMPSGDISDSTSISGKIEGALTTAALFQDLINGYIYFNIHTTANANGEIRSQADDVFNDGFTFSMDGSQEVPSVSTTATGAGLCALSRFYYLNHIMFSFSGITSTGVHFHNAAAGQTGGVIYDLSSLISNNAYDGYWGSYSSPGYDTPAEGKFFASKVYINVHSSANANGEIRGQITENSGCFGLTSVANISAEENQFSLYPNPSIGMITLAYTGIANGTSAIRVFDVLGNLVHSETQSSVKGMNKLSINLTSLTTGMYFIELTDGGAKRVEKITIEK